MSEYHELPTIAIKTVEIQLKHDFKIDHLRKLTEHEHGWIDLTIE